MAFLEQRLDPRITSGAVGGPEFSTLVVTMTSGHEAVNAQWVYPRHKWNVSEGIKTQAQFETVRAMFYVTYGRANGFRFKDWSDYKLTQSNSRCTLISGATYQLQRVYSLGAYEFLRPIAKPVAGTIAIWRTRSGVVSAASATVDSTTGIATISGHVSGDTYTASGEFDVPVRFMSDVAQIETVRGQGQMLHRWDGIEVQEIRIS